VISTLVPLVRIVAGESGGEVIRLWIHDETVSRFGGEEDFLRWKMEEEAQQIPSLRCGMTTKNASKRLTKK
jgi:hypothetical protein